MPKETICVYIHMRFLSSFYIKNGFPETLIGEGSLFLRDVKANSFASFPDIEGASAPQI